MNLGPTNRDFCLDCGMGHGAHVGGQCPPEVIQPLEPHSGDPWGIWPLFVALVALTGIAYIIALWAAT